MITVQRYLGHTYLGRYVVTLIMSEKSLFEKVVVIHTIIVRVYRVRILSRTVL